jgi:hypothetical protein
VLGGLFRSTKALEGGVRPADAFKGYKHKPYVIAGKTFLIPYKEESPIRNFMWWLAACAALAIMLYGGAWLWSHWIGMWAKYLVVVGFVGWEVVCFLFVGGAVVYTILDRFFGAKNK